MSGTTAKHILIVDDDEARLAKLAASAARALADLGAAIAVATWLPSRGEDAYEVFQSKVDPQTVLVASDIELTKNGLTGLFGSTILAWSQKRLLPVCGYTQREGLLPKEPNLFEYRLPIDEDEAGAKLAAIATGFERIRTDFKAHHGELLARKSPTAMLAHLLGHPEAAAPFALYAARLASSNPAIVDSLGADQDHSGSRKADIAAYIAGHVLSNAIMRFPGPLAPHVAVCAYLALPAGEGTPLDALIEPARYKGPFEGLGPFYWIDEVDAILEALAEERDIAFVDEIDTWRRQVVERDLGRLGRHACDRCQGERGGFWCPFTARAVCEREDCSVGSSNLVPRGAGLTRVERDYYDEWAPLLGL